MLALLQGSEGALVCSWCVQGAGHRVEVVRDSQGVSFSSHAGLSPLHRFVKPVALGVWGGEVVRPQPLLSAHCIQDAFLHVAESSRLPLTILEWPGLNTTSFRRPSLGVGGHFVLLL